MGHEGGHDVVRRKAMPMLTLPDSVVDSQSVIRQRAECGVLPTSVACHEPQKRGSKWTGANSFSSAA